MLDMHEFHAHNTDYWRFQATTRERWTRRLKDQFLVLAGQAGFARKNFSASAAADRLLRVLRNIDELEHVYQMLANEASRELMVELLKFRILGNRQAKLPTNTEQFWQARTEIEKSWLRKSNVRTVGEWNLNSYELDPAHGSLKIDAHQLALLNTFALEQYSYKKQGQLISARLGDTVIDGGGCWGDTALFFATKVGSEGKVFSFEFVPENLTILEQNLTYNPSLSARVTIVRQPLWQTSNEIVHFRFDGPSTRQTTENGSNTKPLQTTSIDDLVMAKNLTRVDFIKLDIEGAELPALKGAEKTMRRFKPQLAVAVYHHDDDLFTIPEYLSALDLGYEFYLDHFTIYQEETVLFARPTDTAG